MWMTKLCYLVLITLDGRTMGPHMWVVYGDLEVSMICEARALVTRKSKFAKKYKDFADMDL